MSFAFKDGKMIDVSGESEELDRRISNLTVDQKQQLMRLCLLQAQKADPSVEEVMTYVADRKLQGVAVKLLLSKHRVSPRSSVPDSRYSVDVSTRRYGTQTEVKRQAGTQTYVWGTDASSGINPTAMACTMVAAAFKPVPENGYAPETFSKSPALKPYFPAENHFSNIGELGRECNTEEALATRLEGYATTQTGFLSMCSESLVRMAPSTLERVKGKGIRLANMGKEKIFVKANPTVADVTDAKFEAVIKHTAKLIPSIGSAKHGYGRLSAAHYDGNVGLSPSQRKKQTWLDDFVYVDANVYFVDVKDVSFMNALYRVIKDKKEDGAKFVLVHPSNTYTTGASSVFLSQDGKIKGVAKCGVIGMPQTLWHTVPKEVGTSYVAFNSVRTGFKADSMIAESRLARQAYVTVAKQYTHYQYYAFVGAVEANEKVAASVGGRDGRVIITNNGTLSQAEAANAVFQMVRHSALYPWINACYMLQREGTFVLPGAHAIVGTYDYGPITDDSGFFPTVSDDDLIAEYVAEEFFKLGMTKEQADDVSKLLKKPGGTNYDEGEEQEEEEAEDFDSIFASKAKILEVGS